jgi:hypothetical protein
MWEGHLLRGIAELCFKSQVPERSEDASHTRGPSDHREPLPPVTPDVPH